MRLKNLKIRNVGPFKNDEMDFISNETELKNPPVIIITGENGTGKSIILDAIRTLFMGPFMNVEREIISSKDFLIELNIVADEKNVNFKTSQQSEQDGFTTNNNEINKLFHAQFEPKFKRDFIFDYWTSKLSSDKFTISSIAALETNGYLDNSLSGVHKNMEVTKIISFFDYLKDSKNESEKKLGESLYAILEEIINISITNGKLSHVSRITLKPIIKVQNREISLDKLSSGNLYLIQRLSSLLRQVYSICVLNGISIAEYKKIKGVLLIDEAENHLHPKWQKVFLKNILKLFPKLQIIASTHSPFIISSIENSKVFVCKSQTDYSVVVEETDLYTNKPVEEILMSPLFNTSNFNIEISDLLRLRKEALQQDNKDEISRIEKALLEINPEYFNYLKIEDTIKSIKK